MNHLVSIDPLLYIFIFEFARCPRTQRAFELTTRARIAIFASVFERDVYFVSITNSLWLHVMQSKKATCVTTISIHIQFSTPFSVTTYQPTRKEPLLHKPSNQASLVRIQAKMQTKSEWNHNFGRLSNAYINEIQSILIHAPAKKNRWTLCPHAPWISVGQF